MHDVSLKTFLSWKVLATCIHAVALLLTVLRLFIRSRLSKLWWDDYLVIVPLTVDIYYMVCLWATTREEVTNWWKTVFPASMILWSSRAVLSLGLMRIFPPRSQPRHIYAGLTMFSALMFATSIASTSYSCVYKNRGTSFKFPLCPQAPDGPIMLRIISAGNLTYDSSIALAPIYVFRKVKLCRAERRAIFFAFGTGMAPCIIPIILVSLKYYSMIHLEAIGIMLCQLLAPVALLVCNLLIVMSSRLRTLRRRTKQKLSETKERVTRRTGVPVSNGRATSVSVGTRQGDHTDTTTTTTLRKTRSTTHLTLTEILDSYVSSDAIAGELGLFSRMGESNCQMAQC